MKEGLIKNTYETFIKNLQTILSLTYVIAVAIGMLFLYQKYSKFGINIFEYANVFDFLIAPFSDFNILLFSFISILAGFSAIQFDRYLKYKHPEKYSKLNLGLDKKGWFDIFRYSVYSLVLLYYLYFFSNEYAEMSRKQIENHNPIKITFADNEIKEGILIGKTNDILFLMKDKKISAIPLSSLVKELHLK